MIRRVFNENPDLWNITGVVREEARRQFARLDNEIIELNRAEIAHSSSQRVVPAGIQGRTVMRQLSSRCFGMKFANKSVISLSESL